MSSIEKIEINKIKIEQLNAYIRYLIKDEYFDQHSLYQELHEMSDENVNAKDYIEEKHPELKYNTTSKVFEKVIEDPISLINRIKKDFDGNVFEKKELKFNKNINHLISLICPNAPEDQKPFIAPFIKNRLKSASLNSTELLKELKDMNKKEINVQRIY